MAVRELGELLFEDALGRFHVGRLLFGPKLQQQALTQVAGPHACRFEFLDYRQHVFHLFLGHLHSRAEGHVVHKGFDVAAQVAVGVETADYELPYLLLPLVQITVAELVAQTLSKTFLNGKGIVFGPRVLAPVVHLETVGRDVPVAVFHGVDGHVARVLLFLVLGGFGVGIVVQHGVVFKLRTNLLLQFLDRQLYELDGLDLQRREALGLLEFEPLFLHVSVWV